MRGIRGFGWRGRAALVVVLAAVAAAGCAERSNVMKRAGAEVVRVKVSWLSFPREAGVARVIAEELGGGETHAGIAVVKSDSGFADRVSARFSWVEGFVGKSQEVTSVDMSSFEGVFWESSAAAPRGPDVFDLSISSRSTVPVAQDPYPVNLILADRGKPGAGAAAEGPWRNRKLILGMSTSLRGDGIVVGLCPVAAGAAGERKRLQELAFSAYVREGESLVLTSAGVWGTFGEAGFMRERVGKGASAEMALPFSPPSLARLSAGPKTTCDQIVVVTPSL